MCNPVKMLSVLALAACVCCACDDNNDKSGSVGDACHDANDCLIENTCSNGVCVKRCSKTSCPKDSVCTDDGLCIPESLVQECSETNPCKDNNKTCINNRCVAKAGCTSDAECASQNKVCRNQVCVDPEPEPDCSDTKPCADLTKSCEEGKCVVYTPPVSCNSDTECGGNYACDKGKCILKSVCTETRTCGDETGNIVCYEGACVPRTPVACSKQNPCADSAQTCVQGQCVTCNCAKDEVCKLDGSCIKLMDTATHNGKTFTIGAECEYKEFESFCDNNRRITCSMVVGQEQTYTIKVDDCGTEVCATSPTDGVACYEVCAKEGELYGECMNDYNSETGTYEGYLFRNKCTKSVEGILIWAYTVRTDGEYIYGFEDCHGLCYNGNCVSMPADYGKSCYSASYEENCFGDWALNCEQDNASYPGMISGLNCQISYGPEYRCAVSAADNWSDCAKPCEVEGEKTVACHTYAGGSVYSEHYVCEKAMDGKNYYFMDYNDYTKCTRGCNELTGACM